MMLLYSTEKSVSPFPLQDFQLSLESRSDRVEVDLLVLES